MDKEKDERVLAFQAKLSKLKEKVPALRHSEFYKHRTQVKVLCGHIDLASSFAIDYTKENPSVLIDRITHSLKELRRMIEKDIEILERLEK